MEKKNELKKIHSDSGGVTSSGSTTEVQVNVKVPTITHYVQDQEFGSDIH